MKRLLLLASLLWAIPAVSQTVTPNLFPPGGTKFANGQIITAISTTSGSTLIYTLDGSTPTANGSCAATHGTAIANNGTINITTSETVGIIACLSGVSSTPAFDAYTVGGYVTSNIDDIYPTSSSSPSIGWATPPYIDSGCGDPTGPTSYPHTLVTSPSLDSTSSQFELVSAPEGCVGWFYNAGPQDHATTLTNDFEYFPGSTNSSGNANEIDLYQYVKAANSGGCLPHDTDLYFGSQCVTSTGNWQIWDQGGTGWHYTSPTISCASAFAGGSGWHHVTINDYWKCGDTSGTGGYPKQCYSSVTFDGVTHAINTCYSASALPSGYGENTGTNVELDVGSAGTTLTANVDEHSLTFAPSTYYVSNAGSDSNDGRTKATAFAHDPMMHSFTGSYTHVAGDQIFYRGGDTWNAGTTDYFVLSTGGTSSAQDYHGWGDQTWYSGASPARPIFAFAGGLPNQVSKSPGYQSEFIEINSGAGWFTFDNFEVTGMSCSTTVAGDFAYFNTAADGYQFSNNYFHAFQTPVACSTGSVIGDGQNPAVWLFAQIPVPGGSPNDGYTSSNCHGQFLNNVVDGTDGTGYKGYETVVADPQGCFSAAYNVVHDVCSGFGGFMNQWHDNAVYDFGGSIGQPECQSPTPGPHGHALRSNGDLPGATLSNNYLHDVGAEVLMINPNAGTTTVDNNVVWDATIDGNPLDVLGICDNVSEGANVCLGGTVDAYNNTFITYGGNPAIHVRGNLAGLASDNNFDVCTSGTLASCYSISSGVTIGGSSSWPTSSGETYLSYSQATTDGYTSSQTYPFFPTSSSSPTVGKGITGVFGAESLATTRGCYQGTVGGIVKVICPTLTAASRATSGSCTPGTPGCVDSGADMYIGPTTYPLTVSAATSATFTHGSVTSSPSGINCPSSTCSANFSGSVVLTATPASQYTAGYWGGACSGSTATPCTVTMSAAQTVTANFAPVGTVLPQNWVDNNELTCKALGLCAANSPGLSLTPAAYEYVLGASSWTSGPPPTCTFGSPLSTTYPASFTGLQAFITAMEACRTLTHVGIILDAPPGVYTTSSANGLVIPQTSNSLATAPLIIRSTQDSQAPDGSTICAGGIQDDVSASLNVGLNNPDCTGQNMYRQLGPANSSGGTPGTLGVITGIQTLSVNTTTLCAVPGPGTTLCPTTTVGTQQVIKLANGYISPGITVAYDTGANQENLTTASCVNQTGMCVTPTLSHAAGVPVTFCTGGCTYALNGYTGVLPLVPVTSGNPKGLTLTNSINTANYNDASLMWQVVSTGTNPSTLTFCNASGAGETPACSTNIGPDHWLIEEGGFSCNAGNTTTCVPVDLGSEGTQSSTVQLASHIHLHKDWAHGDWGSLYSGANLIPEAFHLSGAYVSLMDSQCSETQRPGAEGHCLTYDQGALTEKIHNNWIESGSIASLCGGITSGGFSITGFIPCVDMDWEENHFTYPYPWLGIFNVSGNPHFGTFSVVRKNGFETKEVVRGLLQGNIIDDADNSGGQDGVIQTIDASNSSSGAGLNYQSIITSLTSISNVYRNSCSGLVFNAKAPGSTNGVSQGSGPYRFENDLLYNISASNPGCSTATNTALELGASASVWEGTSTPNTPSAGLTTFTATCAVSQSGNCPTGPPATGMTQFGMNMGDHFSVVCGTNTTLDTPSGTIYPGNTGALLGGPAMTNPGSSLTVVYPNSGGTGSPDSTCQLNTIQGWGFGWQFIHNTLIDNKGATLAGTNGASSGANFAGFSDVQDSIMTGGGWQTLGYSIPEGTDTQSFNWDNSTLGAHHLVWPGRTASLYTEYCNNPAYPVGSCTAGSPPTTMYFPAGNANVGFTCSGCGTSVPLTLTDYHGYSITGTYAAGGSSPASDGLSMGAIITGTGPGGLPSIDTAQTLNLFVCLTACGSAGPFPDVLTAAAVVSTPAYTPPGMLFP